jgi:hypothetical protein
MRFYPDQKTRNLKPHAARENRLIRSRSRLGKIAPLQFPLHAGARLLRVLSKAAAGGYGARVQPELLESLARYEIA